MSTRLGIIVISGTLDKVLPAFMLATTAASMGWEVGMFFSFYGLTVLHKDLNKNIPVSPIGNLQVLNENKTINELSKLTTEQFSKIMEENKMPSLSDLIEMAKSLNIKLYPCNTAMKLFGFNKEDLVEGVEKPVGAATFLNFINEAEKPIVLNF